MVNLSLSQNNNSLIAQDLMETWVAMVVFKIMPCNTVRPMPLKPKLNTHTPVLELSATTKNQKVKSPPRAMEELSPMTQHLSRKLLFNNQYLFQLKQTN